MRAPGAALLDAERGVATGEGIETAARDQDLDKTETQHTAGRGVKAGRTPEAGGTAFNRFDGLDRPQGGHERGEVARRVERRHALTERLRRGIAAEALDKAPERKAAPLEALARFLVLVARRLDQQRAPLAGADAATKSLLRRRGRVAFPEESFDDDRPAAGRAGRPVELAHRDAVRGADEHALPDAIERREDVLGRGRPGDDASCPCTERVA